VAADVLSSSCAHSRAVVQTAPATGLHVLEEDIARLLGDVDKGFNGREDHNEAALRVAPLHAQAGVDEHNEVVRESHDAVATPRCRDEIGNQSRQRLRQGSLLRILVTCGDERWVHLSGSDCAQRFTC
jgi:hypothetical protein